MDITYMHLRFRVLRCLTSSFYANQLNLDFKCLTFLPQDGFPYEKNKSFLNLKAKEKYSITNVNTGT